MKLYYSPGACSLSPHIVLRETGAKFDMEKVDLATKKTEKGADYRKVNPKGSVPALELDSGEVLTEGPAIVQYLADTQGYGALKPKDYGIERYRLLEWLNLITSDLHRGMGSLFGKNMPDSYKEVVRNRLNDLLSTTVEPHLAKNDYVMGKDFSIADPYLFTVLGWGKYVDVDLSKYPATSAYLGRIAARPKVQEALKAEGLLK